MKALDAATAESVKRQRDLAEAAETASRGFDVSASMVDSYAGALDKLNRKSALDFASLASDTVSSFDDLKASLKETQNLGKRPLVPTTVRDLRGLTAEQAKVIDSTTGETAHRHRGWRSRHCSGSSPLKGTSVREVRKSAGRKGGSQQGSGDDRSLFHGRSSSLVRDYSAPAPARRSKAASQAREQVCRSGRNSRRSRNRWRHGR
jgi:hypothetical protein